MMFLYRGGQVVEKGIYWEANTGEKVILNDGDFLPVSSKKRYCKLPESYLLIPILLFGLALSMALPYGIGVVLFGIMYGSYIILYTLSDKYQKYLGKLISNIVFEYKPNISYFLGSSKKLMQLKNKNKRKKD